MREMSRLPLKRVGLLHNNFVTTGQAEAHNARYGGSLHATASNVFLTDPARIDLELLAAELQEIERTAYPFPILIQPRLTRWRRWRSTIDGLKRPSAGPAMTLRGC